MNSTFQTELVPTWAKVAAWAVPVVALPSAIWRFGETSRAVIHGGFCAGVPAPLWEMIYVPSLSVAQLGFALLTVGLIRPWGEVFPRWIPGLSGRQAPGPEVGRWYAPLWLWPPLLLAVAWHYARRRGAQRLVATARRDGGFAA